MKRWRWAQAAALVGAMGAVLLFPQETAQAARQGVQLCVRSVIPALFPFFVLSTLFTALGYARRVGRVLARPARRLFHAPGVGGAAFFLGLLGGYPVGARTVGQLYREGQCSREEAERLLAFCNNCSPAFVLGIAGEGVFASARTGVWLYVIHVLAAVLTGVALRGAMPAETSSPPGGEARAPFAGALVGAIRSGADGMLSVCATVVFFQVVVQLAVKLTGIGDALFAGFWELTGGILQLRGGRRDVIRAAALLGWGGLSVHAQTAAALSDTDLSLKYHLPGKLLHGAISLVLGFLVSLWL